MAMKAITAVLPQLFFARPVLEVAPELLGKDLVCDRGRFMMTEVEAYDGPEDKACHGRFGRTKRTEVMFGPAGHWYVYRIYGMYWMLNIVTGDEGYPSAVLIRGVGEYRGPGKLTRELDIDQSFNGQLASVQSGLWIEHSNRHIAPSDIERTARIGVEYAGAWAKKPYRFLFK